MATGVIKPDDTVLYLYGISKTSAAPSRKIGGVDGAAPIEILRSGGLVCWVSRVPRSEFADNLAKNMENLDWLAAMSTRHQSAVSGVAERNDILPARFGTVFVSAESLRADVESRKPVLEADLKRIKGNEEWGIKIFAVQPGQVKMPPARSGKDYLQAKSTMLRIRKPAKMDDEIIRFAKALEKLSVETAEGGKISGGRRDLLYQISLLLKRVNRKKLRVLLVRFSNEWKGTRQINCTGPWPPYSFVSRRTH